MRIEIEYNGVKFINELNDEHGKKIMDMLSEFQFEDLFSDLEALEKGLAHKWFMEGISESRIRELLEIKREQARLSAEFKRLYKSID